MNRTASWQKMQITTQTALFVLAMIVAASPLAGQMLGQPDRGEPGDEMIGQYLRQKTQEIHQRFLQDVKSLDDWRQLRSRYREEYLHMLGLSPLPDKTPLEATVTGTLEGDGYAVDMLHYQSRPQLYVTANLYRPAKVEPGKQLPAVLYVCGHSFRGRDGNKTAYQAHGIWLARHGYLCLVLDSLQLGEIAAIHHGTYREGRWWWHSRGYTPAGVECWNGVRGIDYLISRPDVDSERIAVTGISGGGAATFWIAAADERVNVAVPVSGMADLPSYVSNLVINGHCDCMFLYNTFQWPWPRIAALIAPRPLLFVNSDQDSIFPMDANERVINRLERLYSLYGAGDLVDSVVSIGGHAYRQDIRQAAYRFINMHLKDDPRIITDSEVDLASGPRDDRSYAIEPSRLRVFPADTDLPSGERNTTIDQTFVPMATVASPESGEHAAWKEPLVAELRRTTFRYFPERIPPAKPLAESDGDTTWLETEPGIRIPLQDIPEMRPQEPAQRIWLAVRNAGDGTGIPDWILRIHKPTDEVFVCAPRGIGPTRWTRKNPPNYVERSHVLLGRTVDAGRVWDIATTARYLCTKNGGKIPVHAAGAGAAGVLAAYAALGEPDIAGVMLREPPLSHMSDDSPQLLNVLRVCDIPDVLGMLAPRPVTIQGTDRERLKKVAEAFAAASELGKLIIEEQPAE